MEKSKQREIEYVNTRKEMERSHTLADLKARCDKLEMVLALVVERMGMGHRTADGDGMVFTGLETEFSSLHKSRTRGKKYLHIEIGSSKHGRHWSPDDTKSN